MKPPIRITRKTDHVAFRLDALFQRALEPALSHLEATHDLSTNTWRVARTLESVVLRLYAQLPDTVTVELHFDDTVFARDARLENLELLRYDAFAAQWALAPRVRCTGHASRAPFHASADGRDIFIRPGTRLQARSVPYEVACALADDTSEAYTAYVHALPVPETPVWHSPPATGTTPIRAARHARRA